MTITDHLKWRYATKKFDPSKQLSDQQINIIKQTFNLTATSYGLQPIRLILITNKQVREKLLPFCYGQTQVVDASHLCILCADKTITTENINQYFERIQNSRDIPKEQIVKSKKAMQETFAQKSDTEITEWTIRQTYIALGNLLTVCAHESIDSCPMEGFVNEKVNEILDLEKQNLTATLLLPIGFRDNNDAVSKMKKVRKPISNSVIEI